LRWRVVGWDCAVLVCGVPATPGNFKKVLKKGSVAVIVGGIAEMYMQVRQGFALFLSQSLPASKQLLHISNCCKQASKQASRRG
jgi:hypothetical protein